jgi:hypothetical protein
MNSIYLNLNGVAFEVTKLLSSGVVELSRLASDVKIYLPLAIVRDNMTKVM